MTMTMISHIGDWKQQNINVCSRREQDGFSLHVMCRNALGWIWFDDDYSYYYFQYSYCYLLACQLCL